MEIDAPGDQSGGSTPVQDEPTYSDVENQDIENSDDEEDNRNSLKNCRAADSDEYISDGGEFVREDVQRELEDEEVEREEVERNSDENISDDNEEDDNNNEEEDDDDNNEDDAPNRPESASSANRSRSVSPVHSRSDRSRSTSPQSPIHSPMSVPKSISDHSQSPLLNQHSRSPLDSPSRSRSRSGSPASQRSRSDSVQSQRSDSAASHRSSSWSPSRQNESQSVHRSRSGSVASQQSHSSSHRSASGSPASRHSESRSWRSGSVESQRSLSGSRRSASRSPASHQSRSGSSVSNRSRSRSRRSQSGSPASQNSRGSMSPEKIDSKSSELHKSQSSPAGSVKSPLSVSNVQNSQPDSPIAPVASPLPLSDVKNKKENLFTDSENSDSESEQIKRRIQGQIQSDSEDEDENIRRNINKALSTGLESDDDEDEDDEDKMSHGRTAERVTQKSAKRILSDSEDEPSKAKGSENEDDESDKETGEKLIADIFGSSDEDEEFEGFGEADVEAVPKRKEKKADHDDDDDDDDDDDQQKTDLNDDNNEALPLVSDDENDDIVRDSQREDFVSDFDIMLEKKKAERQGNRRRRKDIDIINDNDDLIADMVQKMKLAAEEDRELNQSKKAATKKLKYLPFVYSQLKKTDLHIAFLDCGILSAMTEWLAPLPDRSLPHLTIRENFLKILIEFPPIGTDSLKSSGIGKAVMYLYKHPKETRGNKICAGKLINEWSRPIFNLTSDYSMLSKEDREERDYQQLPKKRRVSDVGGETPRRDIDKALNSEEKALRPGEKGWVYRARVPMPSNKDYVVRPKWNVDENPRKASKKALTRYEVQMRQFQEKKRRNKTQRAVTISIEGRNMSL